jgi:preprotein translocase subunit SecA
VALYPQVCGMTGTAATQAREFREIYGLEVEVIPTNRPVIRVDHPDKVFANKRDKEEAVIDEIFATHASGRPVLVGTCSVEESERLSRRLRDAGIPHHVLNARNEEQEAAIVARAGQRGAVTISTNMAGRGTDIQLDPGVAELGGLYIIGTNRHESRRIDHQLRGRAGRQGDPGSSRFFISQDDDLMQHYAGEGAPSMRDPEAIQRVAEGQNLTIRQFLNKYEGVIEAQRQIVQRWRQHILLGNRCEELAADALPAGPSFGNFAEPEPDMEPDAGSEVSLNAPDEPMTETERLVRLTTIDDLWSDYLAEIADYRAGIQLVSWSRDPLHEYLVTVDQAFTRLHRKIDKESERRLEDAMSTGVLPRQRGAT